MAIAERQPFEQRASSSGAAEAVPGSGALAKRMASTAPSAIRRLLALSQRPEVISFAGGLPNAGLFDVDGLRESIAEVISGEATAAFQYGPAEGLPALREQLALLCRERAVRAESRRIIVTNGAQQALDLIARAVLDPGDVVLVERPTYASAINTLRLAEATVAGVDGDVEGLRTDSLARGYDRWARAGRRPKMLYVIPNFANPTGRELTLRRRRELVAFAADRDLLIVEDDPYGELYFDSPPPPPLASLAERDGPTARCVYLGSLSKIMAPGLRIGWLLAPEAMLTALTTVKQAVDLQGSSLDQRIAQRYLAAGRLPERLELLRASYAARASRLASALRRHGGNHLDFDEPRGGMFLWARFPSHIDAQAGLDRAIDNGVVYVPGAPFFADGIQPATARLTFASATEDELDEGARRLGAFLANTEHT